MIPLWMFPMAAVMGNSMLLKPSEKDPGTALVRGACAPRVLRSAAGA